MADFGESAHLTEAATAQTMSVRGTPSYIAPEVLQNERYDWAADVYSYGACLVHMATGRAPFSDLTNEVPVFQLMGRVATGEITPMASAGGASWSPYIKEIAQVCFDSAPEQRPRFAELVAKLEAGEKPSSQVADAGEDGGVVISNLDGPDVSVLAPAPDRDKLAAESIAPHSQKSISSASSAKISFSRVPAKKFGLHLSLFSRRQSGTSGRSPLPSTRWSQTATESLPSEQTSVMAAISLSSPTLSARPPSPWCGSSPKSVVGRGAHGVVRLVELEGQLAVDKCVPLPPRRSAALVASAQGEAAVIKKMAHPSIVRLLDSYVLEEGEGGRPELHLIMESHTWAADCGRPRWRPSRNSLPPVDSASTRPVLLATGAPQKSAPVESLWARVAGWNGLNSAASPQCMLAASSQVL